MKICLLILILFVGKSAFTQINNPVKIKDVVINEIFADPNPSVGLPPIEFVELWNTTKKSISLKNWTYNDENTEFKFFGDTIQANEFLILCARNDTNYFKKYGRVLGLSPWPSLNNSADNLTLKSDSGLIVHKVDYTDGWYQDPKKKIGGYTLELVDHNSICEGIRNWTASTDSTGGTPGSQNSNFNIHANLTPLQLLKATLVDSVTLNLVFNRFIDSVQAVILKNFRVNNGVGNPVLIVFDGDDALSITLKFDLPLSSGKMYKIDATQISDCNGTIILPMNSSTEFYFPKKITIGDILISEILFNPRASGVDFVEIYNNSDQVLDMQNLYLNNITFPDSLKKAKRLSNIETLLKAGEYLVLTSDPAKIKAEYRTEKPDSFLKLVSFPSYNNDKGIVSLSNNNKLIDEVSYTEKMHQTIIKNAEGISLERTSFVKPGNETGNFKSAAASVGFATPGYKNSQFFNDIPGNEFNLISASFSPDNDGSDDLMQIMYKLNQPGFVANITIYNTSGKIIRKLYQNITLGTHGLVEWDGKDESDNINPVGIYLLTAEFFNAEGTVKKYRKTIILAAKLN
ncbi:MAG: lamin tail domain-containing protein [Flavobacterium sp.]|nr:lamin tail domain-containing protein [Pedobacter sp.]